VQIPLINRVFKLVCLNTTEKEHAAGGF